MLSCDWLIADELKREIIMRRHCIVVQCFAVLLMIVLTARSATGEAFKCPGKYNCSCAPEGDEYELSCPAAGEEQITVQLKPGNKAVIQCSLRTNPNDYYLLKDVNIDAGDYLHFRLCPLPDGNVSFVKLLQLKNPSNILKFSFMSYRAHNDTLRRKHFEGLRGITKLYLTNNGLTSLPPDLFQDMARLQELSLGQNMVQPPADLFQPVHNLTFLELGKNDITSLHVDIFRNLKKLVVLNLWKNKLTNLSPELFRDLISLSTLDLSHNGLTSLPQDMFKYLTSLTNLRLNGNNFQTLPAEIFSFNTKLITVQLSGNQHSSFQLPNGLFANLPDLKTVDLQRNGIKGIPEDIFWGSTGLINITLYNNQIKELPVGLFRDAKELEKLILSFNQINSLPDNIFQSCKQLRVLNLSVNKITNLSMDALHGLEQLEELDMHTNSLRHITIRTFHSTRNLKIIDLSNNHLSFLDKEEHILDAFGNLSPLKDCTNLEKINLSNNAITEIFADWRLTMLNLKFLNLSYNALQEIDSFPEYYVINNGRTLEIDVRHNKIVLIRLNESLDAYEKDPNHSKMLTWLLEGNPLWCNCSNYKFFRYLENSAAPVAKLFEFVPGNLACAGPEGFADQLVTDVRSKALTCPLDCPEAMPCQCHFRTSDKAIIVDCYEKGLTTGPARIPVAHFSNHTELYLTRNKLRSLPDFSRPGYDRVSKLALGYNFITRLNNITMLPKTVQKLELDHNNITMVESEALQVFSNLTNLTLHGNPWKCDCIHQPFASFVLLHPDKISKAKDMKCADGRLLSELVSGLCSQTSSVLWASLVVALVLGVLIGGLFAVYYRFTHEIKAWLFAHNLCLWFVTEEELDKDKLFDAFVSYSHKDEEFVVNELVPGLEGGPIPFKLCLHYRDWVAGEWIPNQITRSVEDSRRTLVVLSPSFLESIWGRLEFRAAHCQALSEGRARVIVVLYGEIGPTENLDPELRAYLNMNTYLKWGDPWFWKKLRYALPHPSKTMNGSIGLVNHNTKLINGKSTDDKIELICEPNSPGSVTTPPADNNKVDPLSKNLKNGTMLTPKKVPIISHEMNGISSSVD